MTNLINATLQASSGLLAEAPWTTHPYSIKRDGLNILNCDDEPVRTPGCIQAHGAVLVLRRTNLSILQASENTQAILGWPASSLLGQSVAVVVTRERETSLHSILATEPTERNPVYAFTLPASELVAALDVTLHTLDDLVMLEFEPVQSDPEHFSPHNHPGQANPVMGTPAQPDYYAIIKKTVVLLNAASTLQHFGQLLANEVRQVSGMDRVMIYKFHADLHGEVVAESRQDDLPSWLGLHYPAEDIPKPARDIFTKTWSRPVPDIAVGLAEMVPLVNPDTGRAVDMTYCALRGVSVSYTEYMQNMGVSACLTLPLRRGDVLWGLIACHHYSGPHHLPYQLRAAGEFLAQVGSLQLQAVSDRESAAYETRLEVVNQQLLAIAAQEGGLAALANSTPSLLGAMDATGAALYHHGRWAMVGQTPSKAQLEALGTWLVQRLAADVLGSPLYSTQSLAADYLPGAAFANVASGVLAVPLSRSGQNLMLWFRPEVIQTVNWGGDPHDKPTVASPQGLRPAPRRSFASFAESIKLHAFAWLDVELKAALQLRTLLMELEISRAEHLSSLNADLTLSNKKLDALAGGVSRDLQLVTDRETFRSVFGDATRGVTDEHALKRVATHMVGVHLQANRVVYGEIVGDGNVVISPSFANGVQPIAGTYHLQDFGMKVLLGLQSGETLVVSDIQSEAGYSAPEKAAYAQLESVALLVVPILKSGRLTAIFGIYQMKPRQWTVEDIKIAQEIAERTSTAVEHARLNEELLSKEVQLSQMLQIMPSFSAVLVGPTFIFLMANRAYYDLVGRGKEIIGKTLIEALPEVASQTFPALLEQVYLTRKPFEAKAMLLKLPHGPGGKLTDHFVDFAYLPLLEASGEVTSIFVHGVDRTSEFRATQALAQRERELRSMAENTPDGLARFDHQHRHVFINSVIEKMLDRPAATILGKTHRQLGVPESLCLEWEKAIGNVFDHERARSLRFSLETAHAGWRHFSCRLVPEFNERKQMVSVLGLTHDITDRLAYEQRLLEQDIRKDDFLATLAHELRNPLAPIRTSVQILKLTPLADVAARTLPVMERQLGQLVCLIDDLLDVSRISSGKIVLKRARISFQDIAGVALEASRPLIDTAGHCLTIDWPGDPVWLNADPTRLTQILSNLLTNAAKYMRPGGQITFSARLQDDDILISVADTGMGIPADMLETVFERFTQVNRTLDRAQGGLGIGLSLVKSLVTMHGGEVWGASGGVELGSEFTVRLPTMPAPQIVPDSTAVLLDSVSLADAKGHRILVVDDNVDAAEAMVILLELSGYAAQTAFNGQQALDVVKSFLPEVVFLDIGLPDMDGYEVARRLLAEPITASTKLVALTGWGTQDDIRRSNAAGFHAHLTKPVEPDAVFAVLTSFFGAAHT